MQLDTYGSVEGSVSKHLVETTTAIGLHRICWTIIAEMTMAWASGISTNHDAGRHESDRERGTENFLSWTYKSRSGFERPDVPEDTDITATSPIFSDSLRKRSETSPLASPSGPSPRAEQVLPAYTVASQRQHIHEHKSLAEERNNMHIIELELSELT
jgi:hypothetical protein